jgi:hypothetical protein
LISPGASGGLSSQVQVSTTLSYIPFTTVTTTPDITYTQTSSSSDFTISTPGTYSVHYGASASYFNDENNFFFFLIKPITADGISRLSMTPTTIYRIDEENMGTYAQLSNEFIKECVAGETISFQVQARATYLPFFGCFLNRFDEEAYTMQECAYVSIVKID